MFRYVYYRIFRFYEIIFKEDIPGVYAISIVTILQCANLFSLIILIDKYWKYNFKSYLTSKNSLITFFTILLFNYLIFFKFNNFEKFEMKWGGRNAGKYLFNSIMVILYIIGSVVLAVYCFFLPVN